ncbi:hypothetical protein HOY80DRAFT_1014957 [Tuber brumale]|nr:hypothetical protein HOY80DRAFT_1014957 [Tuber brumale]
MYCNLPVSYYLSQGKCTKIVQELYLCNDIPWSSKLCTHGLADVRGDCYGHTKRFLLSSDAQLSDTIKHAAVTDVLGLQTVLDEVQARSLLLFFPFRNQFRSKTYVQRKPRETSNDRSDHAIRCGVQWHHDHLKEVPRNRGKSITVVMVSNDGGNPDKGKSERATCSKDHAFGMKNSTELLDMISAALGDESAEIAKGDTLYPKYSSISTMMTGVQACTLCHGKFNISSYNFHKGSLFHGGQVVVRIIREETMAKNNPEAEQLELETEQECRALIGEAKVSLGTASEGKPQPTARVVDVIKPNWRHYVWHLYPSNVFLIPRGKRIPKIRLMTRQASELVGKRVVVCTDTWGRTSRHPTGHFVMSLGEVQTGEAETEALLLDREVQYRLFPKAVLDCLLKEGHEWIVPQAPADLRLHQRADYCGLLVYCIDAPGCRGVGYVLYTHHMPVPNGKYEAGVPISDEAAVRGKTTYLVDERNGVLPKLLATDICSPKPGVERFAFSAIWEISENRDIANTRFSKSIIRSCWTFSYEEAHQNDELTQRMRILLMLSKKLRQKPMDTGALNLANPTDTKTKKLPETSSLVPEFMLLANTTVAWKIYEAFLQNIMLNSKALADSLDWCVNPSQPFFNTLVGIWARRCPLLAVYSSSDTQVCHELGHYTLFTSSIRQCTHVFVHRQLAAAICHEPLHSTLHSEAKLEEICAYINS